MDIYLISLNKDIKRREALQESFPNSFQKFHLVNAVDGRSLSAKEYFDMISKSILYYERILSPSEIGCSLSHIKALEEFIVSDEEKALIIEDDIIGDDADIETIVQIASCLDENSLLICGGQDGLDQKHYLFGNYREKIRTYELAPFSYQYVLRTCCYVVTKSAAERILQQYNDHMILADDWNAFFQNNTIKIHFKDVLSHPIDLKQSHIETERKMSQVFNKPFFSTFFKLWKHRFGKVSCIISGYQNVKFRN